MLNRRELLGLGVRAAVMASASALAINEAQADAESRYAPAFERLDRYVDSTCARMNAPG
jgi:hypothetical protein